MTKLNVAIADDNERVLTMLDEVLTSDEEINVVGKARNGEQAYEMIMAKKPDVVLLDLVMPGIDGLGVMDKIHTEGNPEHAPSFIIISGIQNESVAENAMSAGAMYYIMKPFDSKEMVARVKAVLRRFQPTPATTSSNEDDLPMEKVSFPGLSINLTDYSVHYNGNVVDMPPKELELFYFLAAHPNQVFTREQLLDHIWSYDYIGDTRTVDVHIKRLREKFPEHPSWNLTTVWGIGYKFEYHEKRSDL